MPYTKICPLDHFFIGFTISFLHLGYEKVMKKNKHLEKE